MEEAVVTRPGFFERPTVKNFAITVFAFMLGLALGNGHKTGEALQGQRDWYKKVYCPQAIEKHDRLVHGESDR